MMDMQFTPLEQFDHSSIQISNVVEVSGKTAWQVPLHAHDHFAEIILVLGGVGTVAFQGGKTTTKIGDLWIYNQGVLHSESCDGLAPLKLINISLKGILLDGLPENCLLAQGVNPVMNTEEYFPLLIALANFLRDHFKSKSSDHIELCRQAISFFLSLCSEIIKRNQTVESVGLPVFQTALDIVEYIDRNYNKNIHLADLESEFHFSQFYLARKFKEETGFTINEYITNRKIGEAGNLLIYTDLSVSEVSRRLGYDSLSHFSAAFKKQMGISPGKMKEIHSRK